MKTCKASAFGVACFKKTQRLVAYKKNWERRLSTSTSTVVAPVNPEPILQPQVIVLTYYEAALLLLLSLLCFTLLFYDGGHRSLAYGVVHLVVWILLYFVYDQCVVRLPGSRITVLVSGLLVTLLAWYLFLGSEALTAFICASVYAPIVYFLALSYKERRYFDSILCFVG